MPRRARLPLPLPLPLRADARAFAPALALALVSSGAIAQPAALAAASPLRAASAADPPPSLNIGVPAKVRPNQRYKIVITVTYDKRSMRAPYLVSFLQFAGSPCKATAGAEYALGSKVTDDYVGRIPSSPFARTDNWKAGTLTGDRRVCAYLYRTHVSRRSRSTPLVSAGSFFRNL